MGVLNLLRTPVTLGHRISDGVDEFGEPTVETVTVETLGHIAQLNTREDGEGVVVTERLQLLLRPDVPIPPQPWDFAEVRGLRYEVDGQPFPVVHPRSQELSHYILYLKRGE